MIEDPKRGELEQGWYWYSGHRLQDNRQDLLSMCWVEGQYFISYGPHGCGYTQSPLGLVISNFRGFWWPVMLPPFTDSM